MNRDLYLWLAALATGEARTDRRLAYRESAARPTALARFPVSGPAIAGWWRPIAWSAPTRPLAGGLEAEAERLHPPGPAAPGGVTSLPTRRHPPARPPLAAPGPTPAHGRATARQERRRAGAGPDDPRSPTSAGVAAKAERAEMPQKDEGFITIRMENILTWGEYVRVDRATDEEDDLERAKSAAEDMERIAVARDRKAGGARLRFDLDLPAASEDDLVLADGELLPEWDWRRQCLLPDHCRIHEMLAAEAPPCPLPEHLRRTARRLRDQFQALAPARTWLRGRPDGQDIDLDAYLRFATDRRAGAQATAADSMRDMRSGARDLACLLLADLSLSTDTWIDDRGRVIDAIRDSLFLFGESLAATGDRFAMLGFSSRRRDPVRVHRLKGFDERYGAAVRGRISGHQAGLLHPARGQHPPCRQAPVPGARRPAPAAHPLRRQAERSGQIRGPLGDRGHPPRHPGGPPPGARALLRHHRPEGQRLSPPPLRHRRLCRHPPPRRATRPPAPPLRPADRGRLGRIPSPQPAYLSNSCASHP